MKDAKRTAHVLMVITVSTACYLLLPRISWAHCDTTGGPVISEAKVALEKGDITPILKWVKQENEAELRTAFAKTVAVRTRGPEAKELADRYFLETLVRLHRLGEGAPYTGIKDEPVEPIVGMADKALNDGSADDMIRKISSHMTAAIGEKFRKALGARKSSDTSVEAGRKYVEAYVTYMHFVEGIHAAIESAGGHLHAGSVKGDASGTAEHKAREE